MYARGSLMEVVQVVFSYNGVGSLMEAEGITSGGKGVICRWSGDTVTFGGKGSGDIICNGSKLFESYMIILKMSTSLIL